ncbi:hypothetical protein PanWU01x14_320460 [Parasponia andersonii]|uniref:Uncharacterized protein n=1 Tax=Parasponia andersonii TaxID=3476 RepID=A0A2P5ALG9_PARAD|nr:hypothetical protein PanWU01x14_320460 [Parasponia andersonii]
MGRQKENLFGRPIFDPYFRTKSDLRPKIKNIRKKIPNSRSRIFSSMFHLRLAALSPVKPDASGSPANIFARPATPPERRRHSLGHSRRQSGKGVLDSYSFQLKRTLDFNGFIQNF